MAQSPQHHKRLPHLLVTAASDDYFWGVLLLAGSLRMHDCDLPLLVLSLGIAPHHLEALQGIDNLIIVDAATQQILANALNVEPAPLPPPPQDHAQTSPLFKPVAMTLAFKMADTVTWIDSDCMAWGDITPLLLRDFEGIRIRKRGTSENTEVFTTRYSSSEEQAGIPQHILSTWRNDVSDLNTPRLNTQIVSNCFTLKRKDANLLNDWSAMLRLAGGDLTNGVVDPDNHAYFMTDESTLTALLTFRASAPEVSRYNLDNLNNAHLIHFGRHPKPWAGWQYHHFRYHYQKVQAVIEWLLHNNTVTDGIPPAMNPRLKPFYLLQACTLQALRWSKQRLNGRWIKA